MGIKQGRKEQGMRSHAITKGRKTWHIMVRVIVKIDSKEWKDHFVFVGLLFTF